MATKLYLRNLRADEYPVDSEQSTALPVGTFKDGTTATTRDRTLSTTKGALQVDIAPFALAQLAHQDLWHSRFSSRPLDSDQTITAQVWTIAVATKEGNAAANQFLVLSVYVWRPTTNAVVGYIYDSDAPLGNEFSAVSEVGQVLNFNGAQVVCALGDILVLEVWIHAVQSSAVQGYQSFLYFEGTTDVVGGVTADAASYLSTPDNLTFVASAPVAVGTRWYLRDVRAGDQPPDGELSAAMPTGFFLGNAGVGFEDRSLSITKGAAQTTKTLNVVIHPTHQDNYIARFTTMPLQKQTIGAGTWTIALAMAENNDAISHRLGISLYVYRSLTGAVVGYIYDSDNELCSEFDTTEHGRVAYLTGASVACELNDVLVLEVWGHGTDIAGAGHVLTLYLEGTTDVWVGLGADAASYIESPASLLITPAGSPVAIGTRWYLRNAAAANPPTAGEKSVALPVGAFKGSAQAGFGDRALDTIKGAAQTSKVLAGIANIAQHEDDYIARFTSPGLTARTFPAGTWTLAIGVQEQNAVNNSFCVLSLYVWRPAAVAVVGYIYDSDTPLSSEWNQLAQDAKVLQFVGASVIAQANDVLVLEVWKHGVTGNTNIVDQTIFLEGTTDGWWNVIADIASYLEEPAVEDVPPSPLALIADEPWSPAFIQQSIESPGILYSSFYGPNNMKTELGERRIWQHILRR